MYFFFSFGLFQNLSILCFLLICLNIIGLRTEKEEKNNKFKENEIKIF